MTQADVAISAKQPANFVCFVFMVDVQKNARGFFANQTPPILCFGHFVILCWREPKLAKQSATVLPIIAVLIVSAPLTMAANAPAATLEAEPRATAGARAAFERWL